MTTAFPAPSRVVALFAPDGRFLMVFPADREEPDERARPRINVVLNWVEELKRLVPRP